MIYYYFFPSCVAFPILVFSLYNRSLLIDVFYFILLYFTFFHFILLFLKFHDLGLLKIAFPLEDSGCLP
jgi:hypothetical protein